MINLADHLDHFRARILQDCLTEATAVYWRRRAQTFAEAAPRSDDFNGSASVEELAERAERCQAVALACRQHAQLLRSLRPEPISDDVRQVLEEVA